MNCREFRRRYTEYRDGHDPELAADIDDHLETCRVCAAFDRAVRDGVEALRGSAVQPSPGFEQRLAMRLEQEAGVVEPLPPQVSPWAATVAAGLVLALIGLTLKQLMVAPAPVAAEVQPMVVARPTLHAGLPFVTFSRVLPDSTP
jgi:hypothetical protein